MHSCMTKSMTKSMTTVTPAWIARAVGPTHYGYTKRRAELICLEASAAKGDDTGSKGKRRDAGTMLVVALRMPGVYAWNDCLIVGPLLSGELRTVPGRRDGATVDFVYVENAAHAHCCAIETLLDDRPGGR
jgi:nucleoside-diphosphate-sugar epimerase